MGQSLRYSASRDSGLTDAERAAIAALVGEFDVSDQIDSYLPGTGGVDWESFTWRDDPANGLVLIGSTRVPSESMRAMVVGVEHWGRLLGRIRVEVLVDAVWQVDIDGDPVTWLPDEGRFWVPGFDRLDLDIDYD